jgi:hypothetical protein
LRVCEDKIEEIYREFGKELYNIESSYKFIQRTCTVLGTVIM